MATQTIHPIARTQGKIRVQGDKSISHRAIILGALSEIPCSVDNFLVAEDCLCTLEAFRQMGIPIERNGTQVHLRGRGLEGLKTPAKPIWCGNSGTSTRLLMGVLTGQPFQVRLEGDASLSRRPMDRVTEPLSKMGAFFLDLKEKPAHLPLTMRGAHTVHPILWKSPVASAQVKSAILLAGLYASGETEVQEPSLSRDHTERMFAASGVKIERSISGVRLFGTATIRAQHFNVPGDLSSAAFFLAAALLTSPDDVEIERVGINPSRTGFLDIVQAMGGQITRQKSVEEAGEPVATLVARKSLLKATVIGGALIPRAIDEFPILAVLATQASGQTVISDAHELRVKESDRIAKVALELAKMGARIREKPDGLIIDGPTSLKGAIVDSHGDHRLAMSLAIAALAAEGPTTIENTECVNTSFPEFWGLLEREFVAADIKTLNPYYNPTLYRWGQRICWSFFRVAARCEVRGLEHIPKEGEDNRALIFAANHRSLIDPPLLGCIIPRPIFYFAKEELFNIPFIGWYIRRVNSFPVRRSVHDIGAFRTSLAVLKAGYPLLLFPEGGRRLEARTQWKARAGVGMLAVKTKALVIPVGVINAQNMTRLSKVRVRFGTPIEPPADTGGEIYQQFANQIMGRIQELCQ